MKVEVFKFGGASIKDAAGIRNVTDIIKSYSNLNLCIVISALGKTTNALERICHAFLNKTDDLQIEINQLKDLHFSILNDLFPLGNKALEDELETVFAELYWAVEEEQTREYDFEYDQIVSLGEQLSSRIVCQYLNSQGISVKWVDARDLIRTDNTYREGIVDWDVSHDLIHERLVFNETGEGQRYLTQGFIGGTSENFTTTLGREGSDYSASIIAHCIDATAVTIWKDVKGVLNADPREWDNPKLLNYLSYYDAIELTYYGATVIHPKTIKPLQNKGIPLRVKSFLEPKAQGTEIGISKDQFAEPCYIFKKNQTLLSISSRDFSFIVEENLEQIFRIFHNSRVKVNLMQNAALSFSVCISIDENRKQELFEALEQHFKIRYNSNCELVTIRNYEGALPDELINRGNLLLEQRSRHNLQMVFKSV